MKKHLVGALVLVFSFMPFTQAENGQDTAQEPTPTSTYYATTESGEQVLVDSELAKAALIIGGYVPAPNPDPAKPGTFLFVDPDTRTEAVMGAGPSSEVQGELSASPEPGSGDAVPSAPETGSEPSQPAQGTITNNGDQTVTVQVKKGEQDYEVRPLASGESMNYPEGSHYIRIIPG